MLAAIARGRLTASRATERRVVAASLAFLLAGVLAGPAGPAQGRSTIPAAKVDPGLVQAMEDAPGSTLRLIVKETEPASEEAEHLVLGLGGAITHQLPIVSGFSALLPAEALPRLAGSPAVGLVWGDAEITMNSGSTNWYDSWSPNTAWRQSIRLPQVEWSQDGSGVTVALLDTGVNQVPDLGNRVLARVDLTPEGDGFDRYGHGTPMAGIIAGNGAASSGEWKGVAPGASLVSVKVAGADGSTDVSVVIAGLQWVLEHKDAYGIRVLNLAFGTDSRQSYRLDPLNYAVEQVWFDGILVVTSAGNRGPGGGTINKPGDDPFVLTVGAADLKGTSDRGDDVVAPFSSWGPTPDGYVKPDVVAPGISIVAAHPVLTFTSEAHTVADQDVADQDVADHGCPRTSNSPWTRSHTPSPSGSA